MAVVGWLIAGDVLQLECELKTTKKELWSCKSVCSVVVGNRLVCRYQETDNKLTCYKLMVARCLLSGSG